MIFYFYFYNNFTFSNNVIRQCYVIHIFFKSIILMVLKIIFKIEINSEIKKNISYFIIYKFLIIRINL